MVKFPKWLTPPKYTKKVNPKGLFNSCKGYRMFTDLYRSADGGYKKSNLTFRRHTRIPTDYGSFWYWVYRLIGRRESVWICDISNIDDEFYIQNEDDQSYKTSERLLVVKNQYHNDNSNEIRMGKCFDSLSKSKVGTNPTIISTNEKNLFTPTGEEETVSVVFEEE